MAPSQIIFHRLDIDHETKTYQYLVFIALMKRV